MVDASTVAARLRRRRYRVLLVLGLLWLLRKVLQRHQRRLLRAYLMAIGERPGAIRAARQLQRASTGLAARAVAAVGTLRRHSSMGAIMSTDASVHAPPASAAAADEDAIVARPPDAVGGGRAAQPEELLLQVVISQLTVRNVVPPKEGLWKRLTDLPLTLFWRVEVRRRQLQKSPPLRTAYAPSG